MCILRALVTLLAALCVHEVTAAVRVELLFESEYKHFGHGVQAIGEYPYRSVAVLSRENLGGVKLLSEYQDVNSTYWSLRARSVTGVTDLPGTAWSSVQLPKFEALGLVWEAGGTLLRESVYVIRRGDVALCHVDWPPGPGLFHDEENCPLLYAFDYQLFVQANVSVVPGVRTAHFETNTLNQWSGLFPTDYTVLASDTFVFAAAYGLVTIYRRQAFNELEFVQQLSLANVEGSSCNVDLPILPGHVSKCGFGAALAFEGRFLFVGAPYEKQCQFLFTCLPESGAVYVYELVGEGGVEPFVLRQTLFDKNMRAYAHFGATIATGGERHDHGVGPSLPVVVAVSDAMSVPKLRDGCLQVMFNNSMCEEGVRVFLFEDKGGAAFVLERTIAAAHGASANRNSHHGLSIAFSQDKRLFALAYDDSNPVLFNVTSYVDFYDSSLVTVEGGGPYSYVGSLWFESLPMPANARTLITFDHGVSRPSLFVASVGRKQVFAFDAYEVAQQLDTAEPLAVLFELDNGQATTNVTESNATIARTTPPPRRAKLDNEVSEAERGNSIVAVVVGAAAAFVATAGIGIAGLCIACKRRKRARQSIQPHSLAHVSSDSGRGVGGGGAHQRTRSRGGSTSVARGGSDGSGAHGTRSRRHTASSGARLSRSVSTIYSAGGNTDSSTSKRSRATSRIPSSNATYGSVATSGGAGSDTRYKANAHSARSAFTAYDDTTNMVIATPAALPQIKRPTRGNDYQFAPDLSSGILPTVSNSVRSTVTSEGPRDATNYGEVPR